VIKGWQTKKLGELLEVQNGYAFSSKDYSESGHFVMRIGNVQNGYISLSDPKFIQLPSDGALQRFVLSEGDILVSLTGNVGRIGVVKREHLPAAVNQRVAKITVNKSSPATREFLLFFLYSDRFREELMGAGHGAAQQNVSTKDLVQIQLPIPPLPEQRRIVGILDEAFVGITTAKANAEKNLQNARALFDSHLQSVFTKRGPGWVEKRLDDLYKVGSSKRVLKSQWKTEGVPFYRGREITRLATDGFVDNELFISEKHFAELSKEYGVPKAGDIVITAIGTIGNSHIVRASDRFYFKDASVLWMKRTAAVSSEFIKFWLKSSLFFDQLDRGNGATVDTLTIQKLQSVNLLLPSSEEQLKIVAKLDALREETQRLESIYQRKLEALEELKKSLLNQAFSGEL